MSSSFSLDDAVTLLLQLEPEDRDEIARLREALADLAFSNQMPIAVQPLVARAVRALGPLAAGTAEDPAAAFAEVSELLERVMGTASAAEPAPPPAPTAPPAPPAPPAPTAPAAPAKPARARGAGKPRARRTPAAAERAPAPAAPAASAAAPAGAAAVDHEAFDAALDLLPADVDVDLLRDFLLESRDCIASSEAALLALEQTPDDAEAVNTVFRAFHTVKGTSAFIGLGRVCAFAHEAESLLSRVRDREISYTRACADLSLRSVDMIKALLDAVDATLRGDGPGGRVALPDGYAALVHAVSSYDGGETVAALAPAPAAPAARGEPSAAPAAAPQDDTGVVDRRQGDRRQGDRRQGDRRAAEAVGTDTSVRVRTDRLDRLIDMVGELVIAQSMIAGDTSIAGGQHHEFTKKVAHAGKIVRELQDLSMSMRMVPLKTTFQKLTRLVRDVSAKLGKDVDFVTEGEDTEIDRNMVDVIGDPLVHMVRNALDHGVEGPDDRERAGKPRQGRVRLSAYQAGGSVIVELQDDGRGLAREKIARKAVEKGLIDSDKGMTDSDVFALIFAPGFSTADKLTDVSGRGVGMDVVKRNIESVRGRVDISSTPGQGTTFHVRLPLTLAVTDGMLVRVGDERYIVPTTNIHMSFRPEPSMLQTVGGRGEVVMLRGEVMPIVRLHRLFDVDGAAHDPTQALLMIVGDGRQRRSALLVDELVTQQQVVAKALGDGVGVVPGIAGGAILGDGRVGLILDVAEVVALAQSGEATAAPAAAQPEERRAVA
jgi:two-component system chemotaxis sensor kinase CheA